MKPKIGIHNIKFKWKNCVSTFMYNYRRSTPMFASGGGSYQDFGFSDLWHVQRHYYFMGYCFLTIKSVRKAPFTRRRCL